MLGAIAGDVIGSVHERTGGKSKDFPLFVDYSRFTDDSVLTAAVAEQLLRGGNYVDLFHRYYNRFPRVGFGGAFIRWADQGIREPYNSLGNGSAMRVSPVGLAFDTLEEVMVHAKISAEVTHNHPEGISGAQATAVAVFLARTGRSKVDIKSHIEEKFGYDLSGRIDDIREDYAYSVTCAGSVPQSIVAFLEADDFEGSVRNAISLGGDADTMAAIAGSIAEAFYGEVPEPIRNEVVSRLPVELKDILNEFYARFGRGFRVR